MNISVLSPRKRTQRYPPPPPPPNKMHCWRQTIAVSWFIHVKIPYHIRICGLFGARSSVEIKSNRLVGVLYGIQTWRICKKWIESYLKKKKTGKKLWHIWINFMQHLCISSLHLAYIRNSFWKTHFFITHICQECTDISTPYYTPRTTKLFGGGGGGGGGGGVYWFHSVRLSVRPASGVRSVAFSVLVGSISYVYILSSNFRRCVV